MAEDNRDYLVERSTEEHEQIPREFLVRSPTKSPIEETENDMRLKSTIHTPLIPSHGEGVNATRSTGYGSTSPSLSPTRPGEPRSPQHQSPPLVGSSSDPRCACHEVAVDKTSRKARIKLVIACIIALVFVIGEIIGGYFSSSLAILTDAAHMLSDFASFLISLFSIWMASRPPSKRMSFGWHRAEVIGAIVSVLIIWLVTGVLCYEAVMRIIRNDSKIDADIMLITACAGVFVNVFMCMVLHQHDHGHGHGHGHGHNNQNRRHVNDTSCDTSCAIRDDDEEDIDPPKKRWWQRKETISTSGDVEGNAGNRANGGRRRKKNKDSRNINVRAAFIHVIGDLIQSIGVLIAGYIIKFWPELHIVDPLCTFLFSILVIITTLNVLRDAVLVIMEGVPRHIKTDQVKTDLMNLRNVKHVHSIHVWSLTTSKVALAAHLAVESQMHSQGVLEAAGEMLKSKYGFAHTTLQVEKYQDEMESCGPCGMITNHNARQRRSLS